MNFIPAKAMLLVAASAVSCGKQPTSKSMVIIGDAEQRPIDTHPDGHMLGSLVKAIGQTNYKCTAFHLGEGIVATAGHCMPDAHRALNRPCIETTITWGHQGDDNPIKSRCMEVISHQHSEQIDFAILKVDPYPAESFQVAPIVEYEADHWVAGHPEGKELHLSSACELEHKSSTQISHSCDTLPGNSGSPILNRDMEVIGIHNGGNNNGNYGTLINWIPVEPLAGPHSQEGSLKEIAFGPMGHNQNKLLLALYTWQGENASVEIDFDIDEGYDLIKYVDGSGIIRTLTGKGHTELTNLKTPVVFSFESDYTGASPSIRFSQIEFD